MPETDEKLTVNSDVFIRDKLGIGISEPIAQLHITSSTAAPSQAFLESGGALLKFSVDGGGASIGTANAFPLSIQTDGTPRISINKAGSVDISAPLSVQNTLTISGNVGIGTSTPSQKLEVVGTVKATAFEGNGATLSGVVKAAGDTVTGALTIENNLTVNGNVGLGTASPAARLHIHSNDDALKITNTALSKTARMGVDGLGVWIEPSEMNSSIRLNANPSLVGLYVRGTDGNIGIGTAKPEANLHVVGNLLGAAKDQAGNALRICCGRTTEGSTNWQAYGGRGVFVDVDTSACVFKETPIYLVNMHGNSSNWEATGGSSAYERTVSSFRVYVRFSDGREFTPELVNSLGWHIQWVAIGN